MKMYLASPLCWNYPVDEVIRHAKAFDFDGVEIRAEHVELYETEVCSILQAKEETGMELSLHAATWDLNLSSINEGIEKQSIMETIKSMKLAQQIGAESMTIHPGRHSLVDQFQALSKQKLIRNLIYLAEQANQLNVTLSIEQMEPIKKEFITTPEATNELLNHLPKTVKTTLDIAHIPLDQKPEQDFQTLKRINNIHISDSTPSTYHVAIGDGNIQFDGILEKLKQTNLPVVLEGFDNSHSLDVLKKNITQLKAFQLLRGETLENFSYQ
ncbi:sugar phosphate isomerase/epimerase family protein [Gracilibacillus kekensis]|uniref:Sugar phosphate isomerase/epimerase n=1 Tax=Gracilibacillus kekensis TaxID=1027249 RepID=A0A1M7Q0E5_9BACI|nr:sugar phosphate isomerase/epimerase family protein [Gracilibacillus kekensis]SHN23543.1 Sugar phosphate isomerase/epimerase [Gracilibacillus kekensis]